MHCYKINKMDWWDFFDRITKHYVEDSITLKLAEVYQKEESGYDYWQFCQDSDNHISIQLFDFEPDWIFRVLETGYYFANKHAELFPELGEVFYDDRTDIPPEDKANEGIADKIDEMVRHKRYFMIPIIDSDLLFSIPFDVARIKNDLEKETIKWIKHI